MILGEYDQDITTEFLGYSPIVNGIWDQSDKQWTGTDFIGDDTGTDLWEMDIDDFLNYDTNFSTNFFNYVALGVYDEDLGYTFGNDFLDYSIIVDENSPFDSGMVAWTGTDFIGEDSGTYTHAPEYVYNIVYNNSNIRTEFVVIPPDPGVFDQYLVYSFSNIAVNFLN